MSRLLVWLAAIAFVIQAVGLPLIALESRVATRVLVERYSESQQAGLPDDKMVLLADQVRVFVVKGEGRLPAQVDGRAGFDGSAVSHLVDVGRVLRAAHVVTGLMAAALAFWLGWSVVRRRWDEVADALRLGAVLVAALVATVMLVAVTNFDAFFSAFHGVFFQEGTWTFPYDSLLIQLFPEPFWSTLGATWGLLVGLFAGAYWITGTALRGDAFAKRA